MINLMSREPLRTMNNKHLIKDEQRQQSINTYTNLLEKIRSKQEDAQINWVDNWGKEYAGDK